MWWVIWAVLILGAVVIFVLIGLRLWRSVRELLRELSTATAQLGRMAERVEALQAAQDEQQFRADLSASEDQRDTWRQQRAENLSARARRRQDRRDRAYRRWQDIGMPL